MNANRDHANRPSKLSASDRRRAYDPKRATPAYIIAFRLTMILIAVAGVAELIK